MPSRKFSPYTSYGEKILLAGIESFFQYYEYALASNRQCDIHAELRINDQNTCLFAFLRSFYKHIASTYKFPLTI